MCKKTILSFALVLSILACKKQEKETVTKEVVRNSIQSKKVTEVLLASGELQRVDSFPSKYITPRPVDVWLPDGYSNQKQYKVLYMHDGQNLFDANTTWNNQEWKADEWITELVERDSIHDLILVGIHNIPKIRFFDLFPEKAFEFLSEKVKDSLLENGKKKDENLTMDVFTGDEYLKFIVEELKPYIDSTYATKSVREDTFIAGSSMGGLMSMYAMCEYPEVFAGAAGVSTHWSGMNPTTYKNPVAKSILAYMEANLPSPTNHKFYFDYGTETLDAFYPKYLTDVDRIFALKGYGNSNYMNLEFEGADHSESSWNRRFDIPLTFLLKK